MQTQKREETRLLLSLAWPCVLENLTTTLVSLVDTAMVGSIGAVATAAVGVCSTPTWLLNGLVRSLGVGGTALVARSVGAGDREQAEHTVSQVFRVAVLLGLACFLVAFFGAPLVPKIMNARPEVVPEAIAYLRLLSTCYIIHYASLATGAMLRGAGDTRTPMIGGILANVLNVLGNFFLIYPTRRILGIPVPGAGMGVRGAALASSISMIISAVYILTHMLRGKGVLKLRMSRREKWDGSLLKRVFRIALPAALERISINVGQILYASMISSIGTAEIAAFHITTNIEAMGYMPANGFSNAATALVGQKLGAGDPQGSRRAGRRAVAVSLKLLTVIGILLYLARFPLAALFSSDAAVRAVTANLVILCALVQPFNAIQIVTQGALNGAGDTLVPFLFGFATMWGVRITSARLLGFTLGLGVMGVYGSMVIDLAVRSALLWTRFSRGKWMTRKV